MSERDLRVAIRAAPDRGIGPAEIRRMTGATYATIRRVRDYGVERRAPTHRPRPARTPEVVEQVRQQVEDDPRQSMRGMARELGVSEGTMRHIVHNDLGMGSYVRRKGQRITPAAKKKRVARASGLLNRLKHRDAKKTIIFSDEKWWTLSPYHNRRNDHVIWCKGDFDNAPDNLRVVGYEQRAAGIMFLGVVASNGLKAPPIFFEDEKINAEVYQQVLAAHVRPWIDANFAPGTWIWQQDGARPHTAASTQAWLVQNEWDFWRAAEWPPSSPDLAPLDYAVWPLLDGVACKDRAPDILTLRQRVSQAWEEMDANFIRRSCRAFRRRLQLCINAGGAHFDK